MTTSYVWRANVIRGIAEARQEARLAVRGAAMNRRITTARAGWLSVLVLVALVRTFTTT
jgi:hypothetical protein